jgi:hypothetical protein
MSDELIAVRCKCGALVAVRDNAMEEYASLKEAKEKLRETGWQIIVQHSPFGCGKGGFYGLDDLSVYPSGRG